MTKEDIDNVSPEIREVLEINLAVALLEHLYNQGKIGEKTFDGIQRAAEKEIAKINEI